MNKPVLVVITSRVPWPLDKGDKLRIYHQIKGLSEYFDIKLFSLNDEQISSDAESELLKYCSSVSFHRFGFGDKIWGLTQSLFKGHPFQVGYFTHSNIKKKFDEWVLKHQPEVIFAQMVRTAEYVNRYQSITILDFQDALSAGLERRKAVATFPLNWLLGIEALRMKMYEQQVVNRFSQCCIITEKDRNLIENQNFKPIHILPNGVDTSYFTSNIKVEKQNDLVFTGNMSYPPNIDAVHFLVKDVMPKVWLQLPNCKLLIAGASPHSSVKSLANSKITVSGWMPDIRLAYRSSKVFVAPLQLGTGLQNKLLEAMSSELPCISSVLVNGALGANENKEILISQSADEYAENIIKLLTDKELASQLSEQGRKFVKEKYSWESANLQLTKWLKKMINSKNY
jgi:sugar transferase (PEP-CTERM/EpsH1 system associated)